MSAPVSTPDEETLRAFLLGTLLPDRAEPVVAWLSNDPSAADSLRRLAADDLLTTVLADTTAVEPVSSSVVERIIQSAIRAREAANPSLPSSPPPPSGAPEAPSLAAARTSDELGRLAGRYLLSEKIGAGGMGTVFRARDAQLDRDVAVKLLPPGSVHDTGAVARFRREAKALARLSHPGIIQAHDSGEDGDKHFLVMEYVEGRNLAKEIIEKGGLPPTRAADYAHQAALALHHAHQGGLIHRDVKPSNLLLASDGRVKLLDLGLARFLQDQVGDSTLTTAGCGMGTPDYCAPEQFREAHQADERADVYALGCTLYHLIAGRVPFPGSSLSEKVRAHETKEPPPLEESCPDMPAGLALVVQRMMAKRPQDRFQTMAEVAEALAPYVATSSPSFRAIRSTSAWSGAQLVIRPRRQALGLLPAAGAAAALLLLAIGLVGLAAGWFRPSSRVAENPDTPPADTGKPPPPPSADPNVLTVSQKPEGGGAYRTITEALDAVKPGQTIRVLDSEVYRESVSIRSPSKHAGITLESPRRATLELRTPGKFIAEVRGVTGVTLRDFHLRGKDIQSTTLVYAYGDAYGLRLENLEFSFEGGGNSTNGVELLGTVRPSPDHEPVVVRGCTFRECKGGVVVASRQGAGVSGVAVRDCTFFGGEMGVVLRDDVRRVQIVGNRFWDLDLPAMQFQLLSPDAEGIVLANNTCYKSGPAFRLWDTAAKGKDVRVCNNLVLDPKSMDMLHIDAIDAQTSRGPGDGAALARAYHFSHNWREGRVPPGPDAKGWIPPDETKGDVLKEQIDDVNRDSKSPDFPRPDPKSRLATEGAGKEDPSLPCYVGALPPDGTEPWDWDRAWRLPKDAQLLTVSKESGGGGKYRTIGEALKDAKPWATIRVLDRADYPETLKIEDKGRYEGLCLDAIQGATVVGVANVPPLTVVDVPNVRVRGLHLRGDKILQRGSALVLARGLVSGLVLEGLALSAPAVKEVVGIFLVDVQVPPAAAPVAVRRCTIDVGSDGIYIIGTNASCSDVRVEQNLVQKATRGIWVGGKVRRVQVTGNRVLDCKQSGLQIENLDSTYGPILMANNTVRGGENGFRFWLDQGADDPEAGQAEVRNNLLFDTTVYDMGFARAVDGKWTEGNHRALSRLWQFGYNGRELGAINHSSSIRLLLAPTDYGFDKPPLVSTVATDAGFLRPAKDTDLCAKGAGAVDPYLPVYIGAVPPEGAETWDWDRTWRALARQAGGKE